MASFGVSKNERLVGPFRVGAPFNEMSFPFVSTFLEEVCFLDLERPTLKKDLACNYPGINEIRFAFTYPQEPKYSHDYQRKENDEEKN